MFDDILVTVYTVGLLVALATLLTMHQKEILNHERP